MIRLTKKQFARIMSKKTKYPLGEYISQLKAIELAAKVIFEGSPEMIKMVSDNIQEQMEVFEEANKKLNKSRLEVKRKLRGG